MAVIALGSAAGSPGVTTSALGLALTWPRPVLLIEADPTGGSAILAGFFRGILAQTKGYRFDRSRKERVAHEAIHKAGQHAFRDRRAKKREFRNLWTLRVNAAARMHGTTYSKLAGAMKKAGVTLDRKSLADLAMNHPAAFERVVKALA